MTKPNRKTQKQAVRNPRHPMHTTRMYSTARHEPVMDGSKVSHRQVVMNIEAASTYAASIHPTNTVLFPWLAAIAGNFEEYRFNHLRLEFIGYAASTVGGPVVMAIDLDANDAIPTTVAGMNTQSVAKQGSGWDKFFVSLPSTNRRWRLTDFASPSASTNASAANLVSCGNWLAVTDTSAPANSAIGFLAVDYEIEFRHPTASIPLTMAGEGGMVNEFAITGLQAAGNPAVFENNDALDESMAVRTEVLFDEDVPIVSSQSAAQHLASWFTNPGFTEDASPNIVTDAALLPQQQSCEVHEISFAQGVSNKTDTILGTLAQIVPTLNSASRFVGSLVDLYDVVIEYGGGTDFGMRFDAFAGHNAGVGWHDADMTWAQFKQAYRLERFDAVVTVRERSRLATYLRAMRKRRRTGIVVLRPTRENPEPVVAIHKDGKFAYGTVELGAMCAAPDLQSKGLHHDTELFHKAWKASVSETPTGL